MNFTPEQIEKAKSAKSVEELLTLAKAEGIEMSEEEIKAKFADLHREGELSDEELDNVSGGTCFSTGVKDPYEGQWRQYVIVSPLNECPYWDRNCHNCQQSFTDGGTWYCAARWLTENGEVFKYS